MTSRETGLAPGKYQVAVIDSRSATEREARRPPAAWQTPNSQRSTEQSSTSGLEYDVQPGSNTINIELSSR